MFFRTPEVSVGIYGHNTQEHETLVDICFPAGGPDVSVSGIQAG
jgi:hypothetical protein